MKISQTQSSPNLSRGYFYFETLIICCMGIKVGAICLSENDKLSNQNRKINLNKFSWSTFLCFQICYATLTIHTICGKQVTLKSDTPKQTRPPKQTGMPKQIRGASSTSSSSLTIVVDESRHSSTSASSTLAGSNSEFFEQV